MQDGTAIKIAAIAAISSLEAINIIVFKTDGIILSGVIAVIAGLAGYTVASLRVPQEEKQEVEVE